MLFSFLTYKKCTLQLPDIKDGVYVHGIFTACFRFDLESMKMASEKELVMNEQMPILHMKPQLDFSPPVEDYICPLYKTSARAGILSTTGRPTFFKLILKLKFVTSKIVKNILVFKKSHHKII